MSENKYIKVKLICIEVQSSFKKIREILTPTLNSQKNQYLPLTPIQNADEDKAYTEMLTYAVSQKDINNIAITGPYGAGKSSVILTFQKANPQWNYLNISLATFKDHNKETESKEIDIETIEKSILQQLFYTVDQKTIPKSRLKRIETITLSDLTQKTLFIILWALSSIIVFIPSNKIFEKFEILENLNHSIQQIASITFLIFCIIGLFTALRYLERVKEFKFKFQDSEITLNNNNNDSVLNKHLDEILYFFERTKFNIIIIEDLDRFENTEIFIRLRELNTLINKSQQIKRHIVFIYAIRDNMFKDKDRSKFFDFIIPIIPVINPTNAYDLIKKNYLNGSINKDLNNQIDDIFLNQISLYFDDLRLVTNIFNEFELYVKKLNKPNLNKNKLLAIIIYKNYYPSEFSKLHVNDGEIYHIFKTSKSTIISKIKKDSHNRLNELDEIIENSNREKLSSINDLRRIYVYEIQRKIPKIQSINMSYYNASASYNLVFSADDQAIDITNILSDEIFEIVKNSKKLNWEIEKNETNAITIIENNNSSFSFSSIEKSINNQKSYDAREKDINNKNLVLRKSIQDQRNSLIEKINTIHHYTLKEILKDGNQDIFNNEKHPKLLQFLLREGYIDENYPEYISLFFNSVITLEERDFAQKVLNHINSDFNQPLINIQKILSRYLTARQFTHSSVLNFNLVDYVLNNKSNLQEHNSNLFKLLANEEEQSKKFILLYIERGKNLPEFINSIVVNWKNFFENISSSLISKEEVDKYLIVTLKELDFKNLEFLNNDNSLSDYISNKEDFINFIKNIYGENQAKILQFLSSISPTFEYLSCESNDLNLFNIVCEKEYFSFNKRMILQILLINNIIENHEEIQNKFDSMPYGILQKFAPDYLKIQVDQSIDHYFEEVYISSAIDLKEDANYFIKLINNDNLNISHKKWLIENNKVKVSDLNEIKEKILWELIITNLRILPDWNSLILYFIQKEFIIDDTLINYINLKEAYESLGNMKIFEAISVINDDSLGVKFESNLLKSEKFNMNAYNSIIQAHKYSYNHLDISELSNEKTLILCNKKILTFTDTNLESIRKKSNEVLVEFLSKNTKVLLEKLPSELELTNEEFDLILKSNKFSNQFKQQLVDKLDIELFSKSESIRLLIINLYIQLSLNIPIHIIDFYFENSNSIPRKVDLITSQIKYLDKESITKYLNLLGTPYSEVFAPNRQKLIYSTQHDKLIEELVLKGYIYQKEIKKYKFAEPKIFFYSR